MNLTLRQLAYFRALAQQRHFGRAAETVNISQPALSVQIREMEAQVGRALVERRARDVVLTPFGRTILYHAKRVHTEMQALEEAARWHDGLAGQLRLGMIPTIAPYILPGTLEALRSRDISLDVQIEEAQTAQLIDELQGGRLDAAVMALPVETEGLCTTSLFEDRFLLAGSAARLAAAGAEVETLRPDLLGSAQLLLLEDGHCLTDQALELCNRERGQARIDMGASSMATLSRLVAAGFGLTLMPELAAEIERRAVPDLVLARFAVPEPGRQIVLVRRAGTEEGGWFTDLAAVLTRVGKAIIMATRKNRPHGAQNAP